MYIHISTDICRYKYAYIHICLHISAPFACYPTLPLLWDTVTPPPDQCCGGCIVLVSACVRERMRMSTYERERCVVWRYSLSARECARAWERATERASKRASERACACTRLRVCVRVHDREEGREGETANVRKEGRKRENSTDTERRTDNTRERDRKQEKEKKHMHAQVRKSKQVRACVCVCKRLCAHPPMIGWVRERKDTISWDMVTGWRQASKREWMSEKRGGKLERETHTRTHTHIYTNTHTHAQTSTQTSAQTSTQISTQTSTQASTQKPSHAHTRIHTHTNTGTLTHNNTQKHAP